MKGKRRCSWQAVRRAAGRAAVPTWFRMFFTDDVMLEKTKTQLLSCKAPEIFEKVKKYEFAKKKSLKTSENICLDAAVIISER